MSLSREYFHFFSNNHIHFYSLSLQVSKIAAYAYSAISQIKVDAKEELVVQFAIPWFLSWELHFYSHLAPSASLLRFRPPANLWSNYHGPHVLTSTKGFKDKHVAGSQSFVVDVLIYGTLIKKLRMNVCFLFESQTVKFSCRKFKLVFLS